MEQEPVEHPLAWLSFKRGDKELGTVIFELFTDAAPRACKNFLSLCSDEPEDHASGVPLSYIDSPIHRIIPEFVIQGGDIAYPRLTGDAKSQLLGKGTLSTFGAVFEDEPAALALPHLRGSLSLANYGPNTNSSQFLILLADAPHLDRKHGVFGRVARGFHTLSLLDAIPTTTGDVPLLPLPTISACGVGLPPDALLEAMGAVAPSKPPTAPSAVASPADPSQKPSTITSTPPPPSAATASALVGSDGLPSNASALPAAPEDLPDSVVNHAPFLAAAVKLLRERGNAQYRAAAADAAGTEVAASTYAQALRYAVRTEQLIASEAAAGVEEDGGESIVADMHSEQKLLTCNLAATSTRAGDYHAAVAYCDRALRFDPRLEKALYRKAVAMRMLGDLNGARGQLLLTNRDANAPAAALLAEIDAEMKANQEAEKNAAQMALYNF